jgi:hypothetical protein
MLGGEHEAAIRWGIRAIAFATELDLPEVVAHGIEQRGHVGVSLGIPEGLDRLRKSLQLSLELGAEDHASRAYANLSHHLVALRLLDDAAGVLDEGLAYCAAHDLDVQIPYLRAARALMNVRRGNWTVAMSEANDVLALPGITPVHRFAALLPVVMVNIRTGAPDTPMMRELGQLTMILERFSASPLSRTCERKSSGWPDSTSRPMPSCRRYTRGRRHPANALRQPSSPGGSAGSA